jgi:hypothetical protein
MPTGERIAEVQKRIATDPKRAYAVMQDLLIESCARLDITGFQCDCCIWQYFCDRKDFVQGSTT